MTMQRLRLGHQRLHGITGAVTSPGHPLLTSLLFLSFSGVSAVLRRHTGTGQGGMLTAQQHDTARAPTQRRQNWKEKEGKRMRKMHRRGRYVPMRYWDFLTQSFK
ncbi:unnamed protein product [Pleuronectes platessa]|uniref:Uncharacterized protein n=1 Tax=Pleuronectes platessa TaxID=8262 RepID=A0A9N7TWC7_PLEPL|nr:unnamed protein product [Pleuronectes platessa]